jgi:hypothetical protein
MLEKKLALVALIEYGSSLIGKTIITQKIGDWPGGICIVTDVNPDENAPEICFSVKRVCDDSFNGIREIGVFDWEYVMVLPAPLSIKTEKRCLNQ